MKIIALANQKGGVGKTTTAVNLSACLADRGKRVLMVDLDPQGNATSALGLDGLEGCSLYGPLIGESTAAEKVVPTSKKNLFIIPGDINMAGAEIEVARMENHLTRLHEVMTVFEADATFDYVFFDCPPSLGILMTNALAAAHELIIPLQCEYFALEGLSKIVRVVEQIQHVNPRLHLAGIVMTMFDSRTNLSNQVLNDVRTHFGNLVYQTLIPRTVRLGEAPSFGKPITDYEPHGVGATAYRALAEEFIQRQTGTIQFINNGSESSDAVAAE